MLHISFDGVVKSYNHFQLGPIDLSIAENSITGLVGVNGAGKTTLIKLALGLTRASSGTVTKCHSDEVGVVYDTPKYSKDWRVREVSKALRRFYPTWDQQQFDITVDWARIDQSKKIKELSRGMGMKLQLAVAFAHDARFLILDEPTSGLDPLARHEILHMIADFSKIQGHSVLFSSHISSDLEKFADDIIMLHEGKLVFSGQTCNLLSDYRIISGEFDQLSAIKESIIGLRKGPASCEGLIKLSHTSNINLNSIKLREPSLDEVVIYLPQGCSDA
ncbi:Vitamin B12 import ATP-binding protein BtuD [Austwickia sp. TVS 96-490-7B]|uniref:ABC transporter ATP-binding protein n=1 Tax=Austwickia sp. TVS 96-490-7B TaxID=2830843 RepID=UPI001C572C85|nr:ABC transporter ATP-binding protein [Austwickia sp. TVS 96-490-7B]MBW3086192.1 Vitamin B12 import ATP-binding protein BtuD [Austwickia sp. TVS 96-490-7B]